jgi:hypothetical protein
MSPTINFGNLLTGLQCLAERDKIILVALINSHGALENGDAAKIERVLAQKVIAAARETRKAAIRN